MEKQLPGAGFGRKYGGYYTMGDDAFCGVPGWIAIYRKTNVKKGCAQEKEQHRTGHRVNVLKGIENATIYICSKKKWKNYVKNMESGGIYIYILTFSMRN